MKHPARSLALGLSGATALGLFLFASASGTTACNAQQLAAQPDAAPAFCDHGPFLFDCTPVAADQPSCSSDATSSSYLALLPRSTAYPLGCTVNFVGDRDQIGGDCKLDQVCKCVQQDLVVPTDAGADADPEAGVGTPAPTTTGTPVWQCG